jgi:hypothetical protein
MFVLRRAAVGEFVQVGLADQHRAGPAQAPDHRCIPVRHVIGEEGRAGRAAHPRDVDVVLDGDHEAVQRAGGIPLPRQLVQLVCSGARRLDGRRDEGAKSRTVIADDPGTGLDATPARPRLRHHIGYAFGLFDQSS